MPKFHGSQVTVKMATSESGLQTASPIPYVRSVEWTVDQGLTQSPKGIGSRQQEVYEGLIAVSGRLVREYDETEIAEDTLFSKLVEAEQTSALTQLYMQVQIGETGKKYTVKKMKGNYNQTVDVDGFVTETYDFQAEEVAGPL
ncbi:MAG: hypothetical protein QXE79_04655 [Candidatus Bathyarchaeia archaeon]